MENHMTYLFDDKIRYDDSPNIDAFGQLRTSAARVLGEYRFQYGIATSLVEKRRMNYDEIIASIESQN